MRCTQRTPAVLAALIASFGLCTTSEAGQVVVPLQFDFVYLQKALTAQVYTEAKDTARVWDDGSGCNFVVLSEPRVDAVAGNLRITSDTVARVGTGIGGRCLTLLEWQGLVEVHEKPEIDRNRDVVGFRVVESNILEADGSKGLATGRLWDLVKQYVHPRLARFIVDLRPSLDQMRGLLPTFFPRASSENKAAIATSLALVDTAVEQNHLSVALGLQVPESKRTLPPSEPALTAAQQARFEAALERWDAFLTGIIVHVAADTELQELRLALLEVLLDARGELVEALAQSAVAGDDPIPALFLRTWDRLAPLLRRVSHDLPLDSALRYVAFVSAADALRAIDALAAGTGFELSADGLRRLVRVLAPDELTDPLNYSNEVDATLRRLFGFGPVPAPVIPREQPSASLGSWLIGSARAAEQGNRARAARLRRWVPTAKELGAYLPMVHEILLESVHAALESGKLAKEFRALYRPLVLSTAWQESCWRQFIRKGGKIKPYASSSGSVGLMQINQRVWRGFYDVKSLRNDIGYNATAGSEILLHYLVDYAIRKREHKASGSVENLVRATYAMYNGGPRHLTRYRKKGTSASLRKIDSAFWEKYRTVKGGDELGVIRCYGKDSLPATHAPLRQIASAVAPAKPASRAPARASAGPVADAWVLAQKPQNFTLQLVSGRSEPAMLKFLQQHRLGKRGAYYRFSRDGQTWYAVVYGSFSSRAAAEKAARKLPASLHRVKPWIRLIADVQKLVRSH